MMSLSFVFFDLKKKNYQHFFVDSGTFPLFLIFHKYSVVSSRWSLVAAGRGWWLLVKVELTIFVT